MNGEPENDGQDWWAQMDNEARRFEEENGRPPSLQELNQLNDLKRAFAQKENDSASEDSKK